MTLTFELLPIPRHTLHDKRFWDRSELGKREYARSVLCAARARGLVDDRKCCVCGAPNPEGHHDSYDRPYEVVWLCKLHHAARHTEINIATPPKPRGWLPLDQRKLKANQRRVSRQLAELNRRKAAGQCARCDMPRVGATHCLKHMIESREQARARLEKRLGRPLRRNNARSYRLASSSEPERKAA